MPGIMILFPPEVNLAVKPACNYTQYKPGERNWLVRCIGCVRQIQCAQEQLSDVFS